MVCGRLLSLARVVQAPLAMASQVVAELCISGVDRQIS